MGTRETWLRFALDSENQKVYAEGDKRLLGDSELALVPTCGDIPFLPVVSICPRVEMGRRDGNIGEQQRRGM